jgi:hypothetical protein
MKLSLPQKLILLTLKNIKTNAFSIRVAHLWFANTNTPFILDPYTIVTYYTSYMTKKIKINNIRTTFNHKKMHCKNMQIQEFKS